MEGGSPTIGTVHLLQGEERQYVFWPHSIRHFQKSVRLKWEMFRHCKELACSCMTQDWDIYVDLVHLYQYIYIFTYLDIDTPKCANMFGPVCIYNIVWICIYT